jgi:hypothetical protein
MAMPKYRITTLTDKAVAERWISRHLSELTSQADKTYQRYLSSTADEMLNILNKFIEYWLDENQRRRLHTSIRQARMRHKIQNKVTITFSGETVTRLNDLVDWQPGQKNKISRTKYLERLIYREWVDTQSHRKWLSKLEERREDRA